MDTPPNASRDLLDAYRGLQAIAARCAREDIDDVQDAAVAALSHEGKIRNEHSWLRRVARNRSRARARRALTWARLSQTLSAASEAPGPDRAAENAELVERLHQALQDLDPTLRESLVLRFFHGHTSKEVAARQGCPHGTARWRIHEGLRRIRRKLDEEGGRQAWLGSVGPFLTFTPKASGYEPLARVVSGSALTATVGLALVAVVVSLAGPSPADAEPASEPHEARATVPSASPTKNTSTRVPRAPTIAQRSSRGASETQKPRQRESKGSVNETCGDEAVSLYNESENDPLGIEYLVEAAGCFERSHHYGKLLRVLTILVERDPDESRTRQSRARLLDLCETMLDASRGDATPVGQTCLEPLDAAADSSLATKRLEAAECLQSAYLVGSAVQQRRLASPELESQESADNETDLEKLDAMAQVVRELKERELEEAGL